jgi:hypothetical protein
VAGAELLARDAAVPGPVIATALTSAVDGLHDEVLLADEGALAVMGDRLVGGDVVDDDDAGGAADALAELRQRGDLFPVSLVRRCPARVASGTAFTGRASTRNASMTGGRGGL